MPVARSVLLATTIVASLGRPALADELEDLEYLTPPESHLAAPSGNLNVSSRMSFVDGIERLYGQASPGCLDCCQGGGNCTQAYRGGPGRCCRMQTTMCCPSGTRCVRDPVLGCFHPPTHSQAPSGGAWLHLTAGVKLFTKRTCKTQLDDALHKTEEEYEQALAQQCEILKQSLIDAGLDTFTRDSADLREKRCLDEGAEKMDAELKVGKSNHTQKCMEEMSNFTDVSRLAEKIKTFINESTPDAHLVAKFEQILSDVKDQAEKAVQDVKDSMKDEQEYISDHFGDDDREEATSAANSAPTPAHWSSDGDDVEATSRWYAALRISAAIGSSFAAPTCLGSATFVAIAGLLALVRRGAYRQVGDSVQQHDRLTAEDSEFGQ